MQKEINHSKTMIIRVISFLMLTLWQIQRYLFKAILLMFKLPRSDLFFYILITILKKAKQATWLIVAREVTISINRYPKCIAINRTQK